MRCSTKYVGLDVHQATTISAVRDGNGKIIAQSILPTEEAALLSSSQACQETAAGTLRLRTSDSLRTEPAPCDC